MDKRDLDEWFMSEILPLEPMLTRFLRHKWSDEAEAADIRQEAYIRIYESAARELPTSPKPFLFQIARNLIIDRLRQKNVVSIETIADFEWPDVSSDEGSPEQQTSARQELRLLQKSLDELPSRCREVIVLRKIEGLSQREIARKMGITEETVECQVSKGMRILARSILGTRAPIIAEAKRYLAKSKPKVK